MVRAHDYAIRAPFPFVAKELTEILGAKLVAYIARVSETRAVYEWGARGRGPKDPRGASSAPRCGCSGSASAREPGYSVSER